MTIPLRRRNTTSQVFEERRYGRVVGCHATHARLALGAASSLIRSYDLRRSAGLQLQPNEVHHLRVSMLLHKSPSADADHGYMCTLQKWVRATTASGKGVKVDDSTPSQVAIPYPNAAFCSV